MELLGENGSDDLPTLHNLTFEDGVPWRKFIIQKKIRVLISLVLSRPKSTEPGRKNLVSCDCCLSAFGEDGRVHLTCCVAFGGTLNAAMFLNTQVVGVFP